MSFSLLEERDDKIKEVASSPVEPRLVNEILLGSSSCIEQANITGLEIYINIK
jgi:hypothetical protein